VHPWAGSAGDIEAALRSQEPVKKVGPRDEGALLLKAAFFEAQSLDWGFLP